MIIVLKKDITEAQRNHIRSVLSEEGCIIRETTNEGQNIIGAVGKSAKGIDFFKNVPGVLDVVPISTSFKLVSRELHREDSLVRVGDVIIGGEQIVIVAGPCAVESREQALTIAHEIRKYGAVLFRGGAFKPRTSPYSFQGMEEEGLKVLAEVRNQTGLRVVTEITSPSQADLMMKYVDVVQIGARNMQNFELLKCVGRMGKPVVLKRGLASTIQEWLMSAEYILSEGNEQVILCERGIRTFEPYTRNTLDLSAIPVLKKLTHLPVLIDPSHATGIREKVSPMARAAVAAGADGLMIEVHHDPDNALSDGPQSLYPDQFGRLTRDIYVIAPVVGKQLDFDYLAKTKSLKEPSATSADGKKRAAYFGERGTFSHKASLQYFGEELETLPMKTFKEIFDAVKTDRVDYGVIPLENSLSGSIHENYDLLLDTQLKIIGEITLRIVYHLIGPEGTRRDTIKQIYAPTPAIEQCRQLLDRNPSWEVIPENATASAVKRISEMDSKSVAAIGGQWAAEIYDMNILEESIEDNAQNFTRFVIIGKTPVGQTQLNKTSLIFSVGNQPGSLFEIMKIFSENKINLVKLESRPIHGKPWEYMFYADLETHLPDGMASPLMRQLGEKTDFLHLLGSY